MRCYLFLETPCIILFSLSSFKPPVYHHAWRRSRQQQEQYQTPGDKVRALAWQIMRPNSGKTNPHQKFYGGQVPPRLSQPSKSCDLNQILARFFQFPPSWELRSKKSSIFGRKHSNGNISLSLINLITWKYLYLVF